MRSSDLLALIMSQGFAGELRQAKPPQTVTSIPYMLTQSTSKAQEPIVQAFGVNGREFVFHSSHITIAPEKFDSVLIGGERYVLDMVVPLHEIGTGNVMGWRAFAKGK